MEPLVKFHPDNINYRADLMTAYFHSQRAEQLQNLIAETDVHFQEGGRWTEGNVAQFGNGCIAVNEWKLAKHCFGEDDAEYPPAHRMARALRRRRLAGPATAGEVAKAGRFGRK